MFSPSKNFVSHQTKIRYFKHEKLLQIELNFPLKKIFRLLFFLYLSGQLFFFICLSGQLFVSIKFGDRN